MEYLTRLQSFLNQSRRQPNHTFLHQPVNRQWQRYTWAEVEHQARCIAAGLKAQQYAPGSRIAILSENCAQWFIADIAIMMAGMISVPIYPSAGRDTLAYIIEHSNVRAIFVGKIPNNESVEHAITTGVTRIALPYPTVSAQVSWLTWLVTYSPLAELAQPKQHDVATIVYTSGATGVPKGVVISHKNLSASSTHSANVLGLSSHSRYISYLPLAHITERSLVEGVAFCVGSQVFFVESGATFVDDVRHAQPTIFISVPRLWDKLRSQVLARVSAHHLRLLLALPLIRKLVIQQILKSLGLHKTELFGCGTAPIAKSLLDWFQNVDIRISEGWGMSETSGLSCGNLPVSKENLGTIGKPLPGVEMQLSDLGELMIRGDNVFSEYYRDHKATQQCFCDGWFYTGDSARVNANGNYQIIGRLKDQFKTAKGQYVVPVPIECCLGTNAHIQQVCVLGSGLNQPVALVVLRSDCHKHDPSVVKGLEKTLARINAELETHQKLECLLICDHAWTVENELLTPSLKVKRHALEKYYQVLLSKKLRGKVLWEQDLA